jgi:hypothetical protein
MICVYTQVLHVRDPTSEAVLIAKAWRDYITHVSDHGHDDDNNNTSSKDKYDNDIFSVVESLSLEGPVLRNLATQLRCNNTKNYLNKINNNHEKINKKSDKNTTKIRKAEENGDLQILTDAFLDVIRDMKLVISTALSNDQGNKPYTKDKNDSDGDYNDKKIERHASHTPPKSSHAPPKAGSKLFNNHNGNDKKSRNKIDTNTEINDFTDRIENRLYDSDSKTSDDHRDKFDNSEDIDSNSNDNMKSADKHKVAFKEVVVISDRHGEDYSDNVGQFGSFESNDHDSNDDNDNYESFDDKDTEDYNNDESSDYEDHIDQTQNKDVQSSFSNNLNDGSKDHNDIDTDDYDTDFASETQESDDKDLNSIKKDDIVDTLDVDDDDEVVIVLFLVLDAAYFFLSVFFYFCFVLTPFWLVRMGGKFLKPLYGDFI